MYIIFGFWVLPFLFPQHLEVHTICSCSLDLSVVKPLSGSSYLQTCNFLMNSSACVSVRLPVGSRRRLRGPADGLQPDALWAPRGEHGGWNSCSQSQNANAVRCKYLSPNAAEISRLRSLYKTRATSDTGHIRQGPHPARTSMQLNVWFADNVKKWRNWGGEQPEVRI